MREVFVFFLGFGSIKFWEKKRKETQKSSPSWRWKTERKRERVTVTLDWVTVTLLVQERSVVVSTPHVTLRFQILSNEAIFCNCYKIKKW